MAIARSKITGQGQISVPMGVRRKLGVGPGSVLEWEEVGNQMVIRRAGHISSAEIHQALFGARPPKKRSVDEMKAGIRRYLRKRHARD
ncbi:MAG: AbrB/MazE/SpoVT family DNA-binding domain-containing protein [Bryobacteraceae bacterium]